MLPFIRRTGLLLLLCVAVFAERASAQRADVVYEPTPHETVERMLRIGRVGANDFLIDLGSGDGRIPIAAARNGARALGIEIDPGLVEKARANATVAGVASRVSFRQEDLFRTDLNEATVVTLYLLPELNVKLRPRLLALRPGTRILSHQFPMGDWKPDAVDDDGGRIYLWIVPASAGGTWLLRHDGQNIELVLRQRYQELAGTAILNGARLPVQSATLRGNEVEFVLDLDGRATRFRGMIAGSTISPREVGSAFGALATGWSAIRR